MKIGVFTVSLPEYNVEESVALLKEMGYDAVEWCVRDIPEPPAEPCYERRYWQTNKSVLLVDDIEAQAQYAKKLCDEAGLDIIGMSTYLAVTNTETLTNVINAASAIGCPQVRAGIMTFVPGPDTRPYPELFNEMREALKTWEPLLSEKHVKLLLEIHHDSLISSPSAAYRALEGLNPDCFGLIFDPGNMVNEGFENYQKSFELLGSYIAHIHVKNGILAPDGEDELGACKWKRTWTSLRKGMADLGGLFKLLKKVGYTGNISMEDFSNDKATREKLEDNLAYVKHLIAAAEAAE